MEGKQAKHSHYILHGSRIISTFPDGEGNDISITIVEGLVP
jgi:hypothetical protein